MSWQRDLDLGRLAIRRPRWGFGLAFIMLLVLVCSKAYAGPKIEHWVLENGAKVYLVENRSLPMLDINVSFDAGSRRDPADKVGLSDFAAMMADKGVTAGRGQKAAALDENALNDAWLDLGAIFGAFSGRDEFGFSLRTLTYPDILPQVVQLAARQIAHPAFPQTVLKREQARAVAALKESLTQPGALASRAYYPAVYGKHPYGALVTEKTLNSITVQDLKNYYTQYILPCRTRISMVGNVSREQANQIAQDLMAQLPQSATCKALPEVPEVMALTKAVNEEIPFDAAQAQIMIGQPGIKRNDPDFLVLVVGNHILGGSGFSSRLMQQVREQRGLTYDIGSYFSPGANTGAFTISLKTRPDQAQEATKVAQLVLKDFVEKGPTQQELDDAKANLLGGFPLLFDSNANLLEQVSNIARNDLPLDYLDQWPHLIENVSAQQVKAAFERVIHPDKMVTVVLGGSAPNVTP